MQREPQPVSLPSSQASLLLDGGSAVLGLEQAVLTWGWLEQIQPPVGEALDGSVPKPRGSGGPFPLQRQLSPQPSRAGKPPQSRIHAARRATPGRSRHNVAERGLATVAWRAGPPGLPAGMQREAGNPDMLRGRQVGEERPAAKRLMGSCARMLSTHTAFHVSQNNNNSPSGRLTAGWGSASARDLPSHCPEGEAAQSPPHTHPHTPARGRKGHSFAPVP